MIKVLLAAALASASLFAQEGMTVSGLVVSGLVRDSQGKSVAEAQVRLFRQDVGAPIRTFTNADGRFSFKRLAAGSLLLPRSFFKSRASAIR